MNPQKRKSLFVTGINSFDFLISILYALVLLFSANWVKRKIKDPAIKKYFMPFIGFKLLAAFSFVILHSYIYKGGDTFVYFAGGKFIGTQILYQPFNAFVYLFGNFQSLQQFTLVGDIRIFYAFRDPTTLLMSQITAVFYLLGFKQLLATTLLISFFSAFGIWSLFTTFCKIYPRAAKTFAFGILFYPSIAIWGSGILKDTITIAAIGWIFSSFYSIVYEKKLLKPIVIIIIMALLCLNLKPYILYTFLPTMLLWMQSNYTSKIKSPLIRYITAPIIVVLFALGGYFFLQSVSENAGKYSLDNVKGMAEGFQNWHTYLAENFNQSGYSLGEVEFTPLGILIKSPEALFVTYFRPTPFEIRNFATAFESLQSTALLLISLFILFKTGVMRSFKISFSNIHIRAFLLFAIIMGVAVGITSYNFGALSRYKIPCLPFYTAALAMIYYEGIRIKNKKISAY